MKTARYDEDADEELIDGGDRRVAGRCVERAPGGDRCAKRQQALHGQVRAQERECDPGSADRLLIEGTAYR